MTTKVTPESEVLSQVVTVLLEHLGPSTVARFLAGWQIGAGDYVLTRHQLFDGETVNSLLEKVQAYEQVSQKEGA